MTSPLSFARKHVKRFQPNMAVPFQPKYKTPRLAQPIFLSKPPTRQLTKGSGTANFGTMSRDLKVQKSVATVNQMVPEVRSEELNLNEDLYNR